MGGRRVLPPFPASHSCYIEGYDMETNNQRFFAVSRFKVTSAMILILVWIAVCILFSVLTPNFLTLGNFMSIAQYSAIAGILSVAMTIMLIVGDLDLSVGSTVMLVGMILAKIMPASGHVGLMILVAVCFGLLAGALNGLLVAKFGILAFIATLGTQQVIKGVGYLMTNGINTPFMNSDFIVIGRGSIGGIVPISFVLMLAIAVLASLVLNFTPFGKKIYSVGSSRIASSLMGVDPTKVRFICYLICGVLASLAGLITASMNGAGLVSAGTGTEMNAIAAGVLGGASLSGGAGSMFGTIIGVILINTVTNGLNLLGVSVYWQTIVRGGLLIVAILAERLKKR